MAATFPADHPPAGRPIGDVAAQYNETEGRSLTRAPDEFAEFETSEAKFDAMLAEAETSGEEPLLIRQPRLP